MSCCKVLGLTLLLCVVLFLIHLYLFKEKVTKNRNYNEIRIFLFLYSKFLSVKKSIPLACFATLIKFFKRLKQLDIKILRLRPRHIFLRAWSSKVHTKFLLLRTTCVTLHLFRFKLSLSLV